MHSPTVVHWTIVKRILPYLNCSSSHRLHITVQSLALLHAYCDSDWTPCPDDRHPTTKFYIFRVSNLIFRSLKRQQIIARSSTKAEY
jgi:hypothetical protein